LAMNTGSASAQSVGGSQSERFGGDTQTPLPPESPSSGKSDAGKTSKNPPSKPSGKAQGNKDTSVGGSQSERSGGDTQTPLPPESPSSGKSSTKQKEPSSPMGK